jgi:tetratricopeptide (TPR) repeat protein
MTNNNSAKTAIPFLQKIGLVLSGLLLTLIILEIGLRLEGFIILSSQERRNLQAIKQKGTYRIMCLGESTTQGAYPAFLKQALNQRNIGVKFSVIDKGLGGVNTGFIVAHLEANLDTYKPDMVVAMIGINDGGSHIPYEAATTSKGLLFLRSLRTYKLLRLLWLHIITRAGEIRSAGLESDEKPLLGTGLKAIYIEQDSLSRREESIKKSLELNPRNDNAYVSLGWVYNNQGRLAEAQQAFRKSIELNPRNDQAYAGLGRVYKVQSRLAEAQQAFRKSIELNPRNDKAYAGLGWVYIDQARLAEAERAFKKSLELNPKNEKAYTYAGLGSIYIDQGRLAEAERAFKKSLELNPGNYKAYGGLETVYFRMGENKLFQEYRKKMKKPWYYNAMMVNNYLKLAQILEKRNVQLVCVQYPLLSVEPLKEIFAGHRGIIFVDNEKIFKDAVRKDGYKAYFIDIFAVEFGHCTKKGNALLAQNIADEILKKVFGK